VADKLIDKAENLSHVLTEDESNKVKDIFERAINNTAMSVEVEGLNPEELPVTITMEEFMRRMKDMAKTGGGMGFYGSFPDSYKVAINGNHPVIDKILKAEDENAQLTIAKQAFDLAMLSQGMLSGKELTEFVKRSVEMI
jgi:molecular chaperone HtpG